MESLPFRRGAETVKFIVHDATGKIVRTGSCPDDLVATQAGAGEIAIADTWQDTHDERHRIVDGARVDFTPEPKPPLSIEAQRASAYPSFTDQLDAIWKGGAEAENMRLRVMAVKAKYAKPIEAKP